MSKTSKRFRDYDKIFKPYSGKALEHIAHLQEVPTPQAIIDQIQGWPNTALFRESYPAEVIANAVYEGSEAYRWQMFRVSLKGLSIRQKLWALNWYWTVFVSPADGKFRQAANNEIIRINNYLGALKRGGFLDSNLKIIKG